MEKVKFFLLGVVVGRVVPMVVETTKLFWSMVMIVVLLTTVIGMFTRTTFKYRTVPLVVGSVAGLAEAGLEALVGHELFTKRSLATWLLNKGVQPVRA